MKIELKVNGQFVSCDVPPETLLSDFLRTTLGLTGTHVGCDTSQCGACVISVDGNSIKSCSMLAVQANGTEIKTIEGMEGLDNTMHAVQAAFKECHGLQCGFCTPGMVMSAADLLTKNANPSEADIRHWLEGNICRCTGYHNIVKAVLRAAEILRH